MAGGNKSNSLKAKKRKVQMQAKARSDAAARRNRGPYRGGAPRTDNNG
jgi:hypothetical protein